MTPACLQGQRFLLLQRVRQVQGLLVEVVAHWPEEVVAHRRVEGVAYWRVEVVAYW